MQPKQQRNCKIEKWKSEWQEQVQKATDEGYARTQLQIENGKLKKQVEIDAEQIRALQKQNGELTDELTKKSDTNHQLVEQLAELTDRFEQEKNLSQCRLDHNEQLRGMIEKMKCCANCKHSRTEYEHCRTNKHEKWELAE